MYLWGRVIDFAFGTGKINNPNTQMHDHSLSRLGTGKINNPNTQKHDRPLS
jgi:hypothetical protein